MDNSKTPVTKKRSTSKKKMKVEFDSGAIYRLVRDIILIGLLVFFIFSMKFMKMKEVINTTHTASMELFYDEYANEIKSLSHQTIKLREDKIRVLLEKYIQEKYRFSIFTPAEKVKFKNDTLIEFGGDTNDY